MFGLEPEFISGTFQSKDPPTKRRNRCEQSRAEQHFPRRLLSRVFAGVLDSARCIGVLARLECFVWTIGAGMALMACSGFVGDKGKSALTRKAIT